MNEETKNEMRKIFAEEFAKKLGQDKYVFTRDIQIVDGRNIQLAKGTGTMIGTESTQKLGLYGKTPIAKQAAIVMPNVQTGVYVQADAETLRSAINDLYNRIQTIGICS